MEFALVGPHQGKTMSLGGFRFKDGVTEVPDEARDAHNLLQNHYSCYPSHRLGKDSTGKLFVKEASADEPSLAGAAPVASNEPSGEVLSDLSKAELKVMASEMSLDVNGTKDDLIARIQEAKQSLAK